MHLLLACLSKRLSWGFYMHICETSLSWSFGFQTSVIVAIIVGSCQAEPPKERYQRTVAAVFWTLCWETRKCCLAFAQCERKCHQKDGARTVAQLMGFVFLVWEILMSVLLGSLLPRRLNRMKISAESKLVAVYASCQASNSKPFFPITNATPDSWFNYV